MSLLSLGLTISTIYLYFKKSSVDVKVVYIPEESKLPEIEVPATEENEAIVADLEASDVGISFEKFDYPTIVAYTLDVIEAGTVVSTFVVNSEDALKIIRSYQGNYLINKLSEESYFVVVEGNRKYPGLLAGKSVYTIFLKSGTNARQIFEDIINLRSKGYTSYAMKFKKGDVTYYALCLGAFPDKDAAQYYYDNVFDLEEIRKSIYVYGAYVGRVTP
ncbi:hypothetical protein JYK00_04840 [Thermosipho ferrireducens]|uniref:SPOR domain-containing protein n=1 Tax=Thermosipho ferrireducens TaxID=2571116 RepID=A0ABX7SAF0_9BACT|nr:hypothetical protein JYK00_04840 [Thermosipho ferrireducens]